VSTCQGHPSRSRYRKWDIPSNEYPLGIPPVDTNQYNSSCARLNGLPARSGTLAAQSSQTPRPLEKREVKYTMAVGRHLERADLEGTRFPRFLRPLSKED